MLLLQAIQKVNSNDNLKVDGLQYVLIREDRYEDVLNLYQDHFFPDEPLAQSIGLLMDDELRGLMRSAIQEHVSIALVSVETGKVVGGRVIKLETRNDTHDVSALKSDVLRTYVTIISELDRRCNIYNYYNVEDVIHFYGICVHSDYRRRGIGEKLMRAAVCFVSHLDLGDVVIKGEGTSVFSRQVFEKIGFETLSEVVFADYTVDGKAVTAGRGEHKLERLYWLRVKSTK